MVFNFIPPPQICKKSYCQAQDWGVGGMTSNWGNMTDRVH